MPHSTQPAAGGGPDPLPSPTEVDWPAVRLAYEESALAVGEILQRFRIPAGELYRRAGAEGWRLRQPRTGKPRGGRRTAAAKPGRARPIDRAALVDRLFQVVERQIGDIEARLARAPDAETAPADEKDARTLAALARTLELLIGLEKIAVPPAETAEVDIDAFRADIARRLAGLRGEP
ncbi:hypothetical protein [Prosthecomicrobium sp. N25]|uniref:hypothetical protein n=1 Tax=Prosthecomicrobium sp. N25 TaxID=3129254 RepID=UPI0030772B53